MTDFIDSNTLKEDNVYTVSQLTGLIKTMLEGTFPSVQLKGEISNFRPNTSGHLYFVLKDNDAQISAVMFRGRAAGLSFVPKDGMLVQVTGTISVYALRGNYQIIINSMSKAGTGDIMEMIEERKKRLSAEGLFDQERKRAIPYLPKTVGIITSPTGAALRDILQISKRRNDKINITIFPALVQGEDAAQSITKMIKIANKYSMCDVLIVGRGGGSLEDLLPFSDEEVVRAIADSDIPVISAVGHEIDWALSDFAADVRAPTPSAAAELAIPLKQDIKETLTNAKQDLYDNITSRIQKLKLMLKTFTPDSMELQFRSIEQPYLMRFDNAKKLLEQNISELLKEKRNIIQACMQTLENCNPQTIFDKGYSMVTDTETGKIIRNASEIKMGAAICIRPSQGLIEATVTGIKN
ncbi:MAG: exodeoxyribonuclease VII large subunit [Treponema sp.]|nr:exodeoxyribonuclease VII large subunit [Treponema sp.]